MLCNNPNLDLVNMNAYIKFGEILPIGSQYTVILLPAHPASFAHNFVSEMQSFLFQRVPVCNSIADCH